MCGIAGVLNFNERAVAPDSIRKMTDSIAHRGPDGSGIFTEGPIGLGHRRLSIIDLSDRASQPMHSKDGRYVLTYNGEIYNFRQIRQELVSIGHQFVSSSDTEVLLTAFEQWNGDCVKKLDGMFAFAIWDRKERCLALAKDRYGIKPLYYCQVGESFVFGSEIKSILASEYLKHELDLPAVYEYFTFQNLFSNRTLHKDIHTLEAGHTLTIKAVSKHLHKHQYWDFNFDRSQHRMSEADTVEQINSLLSNAVSKQLVSDVDVTTYLSGGVDSGTISAIAAKHIPNVSSFTVGFDTSSASGLEIAFDEREKAEYMSYLFKTEHYEMVLKSGDMERCMADLVWHLEEPRVGQCYPNYYAAKLASKFGKVVLSGIGGDEIFAGYPWRYYKAAHAQSFDGFCSAYYDYWQRLLTAEDRRALFNPIWNEVKHVDTFELFRDVFSNVETRGGEYSVEECVNLSLYMECKTFLPGLLTVEDKLSMSHSLETRVPFLDNDLVDFATAIPIEYKVGDIFRQIRVDENQPGKRFQYDEINKSGKRILRDVMKNYLPEDISNRRKQGFSAPDASWFKGESIDFVRSTLFSSNTKISTYLDPKTISHIFNQHNSGNKNNRLAIWSLVYFEFFLQQFGF